MLEECFSLNFGADNLLTCRVTWLLGLKIEQVDQFRQHVSEPLLIGHSGQKKLHSRIITRRQKKHDFSRVHRLNKCSVKPRPITAKFEQKHKMNTSKANELKVTTFSLSQLIRPASSSLSLFLSLSLSLSLSLYEI